jgi:hypothetical protein
MLERFACQPSAALAASEDRKARTDRQVGPRSKRRRSPLIRLIASAIG